MENLKRLITEENNKYRDSYLTDVQSIEGNNTSGFSWQLNQFLPKGKQGYAFKDNAALKTYLTNRIMQYYEKRLQKELERLNFTELKEIKEVTITVEWKKNATWGANPTAEAFIIGRGIISSGSIGGCGYDKLSTAVAKVLNQIPQFIKLMYEVKDTQLDKNNQSVFGYGSGYGILPHFEGGVGVECYPDIFKRIGYNFRRTANGKTFDVFTITKI